jgi:hypothetical protein
MKHQKLEITKPARIEVQWYDKVCGTPQDKTFDGEVIGWRETQVIVRVPEYGVLRFWKKTGLEVGNADHQRRGFQVDIAAFVDSVKPAPGVEVDLSAFVDSVKPPGVAE